MRTIRAALIWAAVAAAALCARPAFAQNNPQADTEQAQNPETPASQANDIQRGSVELQVWTGGGLAPNDVTKGDGVWNLGARFGWMITPAFMPGPFRGRIEYAVDVVPLFMVYQPTGPDYGFGVFPVDLEWVYAVHGRVVPYWEFDGGLLFSRQIVPQPPYGSSAFNFMPSVAAGVHFFRGKFDWNAEIRYLHISDGGIREPNFGINTIEVRIGFGTFRTPRHK